MKVHIVEKWSGKLCNQREQTDAGRQDPPSYSHGKRLPANPIHALRGLQGTSAAVNMRQIDAFGSASLTSAIGQEPRVVSGKKLRHTSSAPSR